MTKANFLIIATTFIFLNSCNNSSKKDEKKAETSTVRDLHNTQNSIDWEGTYFGKLPCASCPGINTLITLNADGTYEKTEEYLESKETPITTKGKFKWIKNSSQIAMGEFRFLVGENQLIELDADGNKITGELAEDYILKKTKYNEEPLE